MTGFQIGFEGTGQLHDGDRLLLLDHQVGGFGGYQEVGGDGGITVHLPLGEVGCDRLPWAVPEEGEQESQHIVMTPFETSL